MDRDQFAALVRESLSHIYDVSYLRRHQLSAVFTGDHAEPAGQPLHRALLEGIEHLRPPRRVPPSANAWRPYLVLSLRYAEERTTEQVAQEIGISLRQLRREHARGVQMLVDLLWEKHGQFQSALPPDAPARSAVDSDVALLGGARPEVLTSLDLVMQSVLDTLQRHAGARHVTFDVRFPQRLPRLPVERAALRQVLLNLLSHAIETGGAGVVSVIAQRKQGELQVSIRHSGKAALLRQAVSQDERLSVAEGLITAQGGRLSVQRDGALDLTIVLPVHQLPAVLIIDDNIEMIELYRRYLAGSLYEVIEATTGQEGIRLAQEIRPAAIILDVMMPDQDGWEILQHLRNLVATKDIPVILCSVLKERDLAFSLGASEFLAKPVTQKMLLSTLGACMMEARATEYPGQLSDSASPPPPRSHRRA